MGLRGKEPPCTPPKELDMTKVDDVVKFLESHSWKVIASTEPYGEQKTTFARFQCRRCKAEWVSLASNPSSRK